jgi:hypothetical protein
VTLWQGILCEQLQVINILQCLVLSMLEIQGTEHFSQDTAIPLIIHELHELFLKPVWLSMQNNVMNVEFADNI